MGFDKNSLGPPRQSLRELFSRRSGKGHFLFGGNSLRARRSKLQRDSDPDILGSLNLL